MAKHSTLRCCACRGEVTFLIPEAESDFAAERPTLFHTLPTFARFDGVGTSSQVLQYFADCGHINRAN